MSVKRGARTLLRLEQIAVVLAELELFHWIELLELNGHLPFSKRMKHGHYDTQPKTLRAVCEHLGGAFLKLGQLLALRPDLVGTAFSKEFEKLLQDVPAEPWNHISTTISLHVPGGLGAFRAINRTPIASGSIAQVHQAVLRDGTAVAVKVKRTDVDERFADDIAIMRMLAKRHARQHGTAGIDAPAVVEEFAAYTARELTMTHELRNMQRFSRNFSRNRTVRIPTVYPQLSGDHVLVMEFISSTPLLALRGSAYRSKRRGVVKAVVDMAYQQLFVDGFFHADMHAGNIAVANGKIALFDYGIVGYVDQNLKRQLLDLFRAMTAGDIDATARVLVDMHTGEREPDLAVLQEGLYFALSAYYGEKLGVVPMGSVLMECIEAARRANLKLPAQLVLFAKSVVTLEGVCAAVDPEFDLLSSAKPFLRTLERQAFRADHVVRETKDFAVLTARAVSKLPNAVGRVERHLRTLDERIVGIDETFRFLSHTILRVSKLLVAVLLFVATLLVSALLIRTEPQWHGVSLYTLTGAAASLLLLFFIIELMRRKP